MNHRCELNLDDFRVKPTSLFAIQKDFTQRQIYLKQLESNEKSRNERRNRQISTSLIRKYNNIELRRKRNKISAKKSRDNMKYRFTYLEAENRNLRNENFELRSLMNGLTCNACHQKMRFFGSESSSFVVNEDATTVTSVRIPEFKVSSNDNLSEYGIIFGNNNAYSGSTTGSASRLSLFALAIVVVICIVSYPSAYPINESQSRTVDVHEDSRNLRESTSKNLPIPSQGRFLSTLKEINLDKYFEIQRKATIKKETDCLKQTSFSNSVMLASTFKDNAINSHTFYLDLSGVEQQNLTPSYINTSNHLKIVDYLTSLGSTIKDKCFFIQMKLPTKLLTQYSSEDSTVEVGCRIVEIKKELSE